MHHWESLRCVLAAAAAARHHGIAAGDQPPFIAGFDSSHAAAADCKVAAAVVPAPAPSSACGATGQGTAPMVKLQTERVSTTVLHSARTWVMLQQEQHAHYFGCWPLKAAQAHVVGQRVL
jgi:hypothetical protein